jgi:hypothetical protein
MGAHHLQPRDSGHEVGDVIIGRVHDDIFRGADLHHAPITHDGNAVANAHRLVKVVGDEDGGLLELLRQLDELVLQLAADQRVERAERLVHQQHVRVGCQRAGKAHTLLHAARQLMGKLVAPGPKLHNIENAGSLFQPVVLADLADFQRHRHVVQHRAVRQQREVLEHHADLAVAERLQLLRAERHHVGALDHDLAGGGLQQPVEVAHQGGLAAARQAHDAEDLTAVHTEADIGHANNGVVAGQHFGLAQPFGLDRGQRSGCVVAEDLPDIGNLDNHVTVTGR